MPSEILSHEHFDRAQPPSKGLLQAIAQLSDKLPLDSAQELLKESIEFRRRNKRTAAAPADAHLKVRDVKRALTENHSKKRKSLELESAVSTRQSKRSKLPTRKHTPVSEENLTAELYGNDQAVKHADEHLASRHGDAAQDHLAQDLIGFGSLNMGGIRDQKLTKEIQDDPNLIDEDGTIHRQDESDEDTVC